MNHDLLKTIIFDQHEVIRNAEIVPRNYIFEENGNYVLVGLRRAGKSTMLFKIVQELILKGIDWTQIIYINFEDERLSEFTAADFNDILSVQAELSDEKGYFFLDEIQNISGWEKFARRLGDAKERVYITGSNAKMLSGEISTTLGGRYLTQYITPYNFEEYLTALGVLHDQKALLQTKTNGKIRGCCTQYLNYGGFPESLLFKSKREYISSVYQKILLGDIITRNSIRNDYAVKILMKKIAETVCTEVSFSKLCNVLKGIGVPLSKNTIIDYVQSAENAYLLFHLQNYYARFVERESNPKYYFSDNGILNLFLNDKNTALLENIVAIALVNTYPEDVYYLKSNKTGINIDFYIPEKGIAVQAAYSIAGDARKREVENLKKLAKYSTETNRFIIVTNEEDERIMEDNIQIEVIPVYKFLLQLKNEDFCRE
ncbi:MAG: ATP-binding protein [Lachnospiraceae bacterium]|nr:ATP-binding protein [Lachnospiraceae bacterium]